MKNYTLPLFSVFFVSMAVAMEAPKEPCLFELVPVEVRKALMQAVTAQRENDVIQNLRKLSRPFGHIFDNIDLQDALINNLAVRFNDNDRISTVLQLQTKWAAEWLRRMLGAYPNFSDLRNIADRLVGLLWLGKNSSQNTKALIHFFLTYFPESVNVSSNQNYTLLMAASEVGLIDVVYRLLAQHGINVDKVNPEHGFTALIYAVIQGHEAIVHLLINAGADIDVRTRQGLTPLMYAVQHGRLPIIYQLLAAGANLNAKSNCGSILDIARRSQNVNKDAILQLLHDEYGIQE